jgi:hypothetical protein
MRPVIDGERLSGHRNRFGEHPTIISYDGQGPGGGSAICSIECFHWAIVHVEGDATRLSFGNKTCLTISGGGVKYSE